MKFFFTALVAAMAVSSSEAFSAQLNHHHRAFSTSLMATEAASSDLVAEALELSKKHGPTSKEARLAWEAVEEINASDNSVASMGSLTDECEVEVVSQECLEYNAALEELQELIQASQPQMSSLSGDISKTLNTVKLSAPIASVAPQSPELQNALAEARSVTAEQGLDSPAAAVAWEAVEEIAASGSTTALGGKLTADECLVEAAQEACAALEELNRIMDKRSS
eukprot:jgi/Psemu1/282771/fgenesh1_pg.13_\